MTASEIPHFVPLPDVPAYTDEVEFGALGLPIGFDDERLLINLPAINRVRTIAALGGVSVYKVNGDSETLDFSIGSINGDGTATMTGVRKTSHQPLSRGRLALPRDPSCAVVWNPDVHVHINSAEADAKIIDSKSPRGALDPKLQAQVLNDAIKKGLNQANHQVNMSSRSWRFGYTVYALPNAMLDILGFNPEVTLPATIVAAHAIRLFGLKKIVEMHNRSEGHDQLDVLDQFKKSRHSLIPGVPIERYVGAAAVLKTHKLVKARS